MRFVNKQASCTTALGIASCDRAASDRRGPWITLLSTMSETFAAMSSAVRGNREADLLDCFGTICQIKQMRHQISTLLTPEMAIIYLLRHITQISQTELEPRFSAKGITSSQWSALESISIGRSSTCSELAGDLDYDRGAITRLVATLEQKGWLQRKPDRLDRRVKRLTLTDDGDRIATVCLIASWNMWLSEWRREDVDQLIALLQRLRSTVEDAAMTDTL